MNSNAAGQMRRAAVVALAALLASACGTGLSMPLAAGFAYDTGVYRLPDSASSAIAGPLTEPELARVKHVSRAEVTAAFSGLRVEITDDRRAFWRVTVRPALRRRSNKQLPTAGESLPLGRLGGVGDVAFDFVAAQAIHYAPADASRQDVLDAVGRGVGRVAVHEFMHQMLGGSATHNDADPLSYEYGRPDRAAQYYGELHWSTAWPSLVGKFGR